MFEFNKSQLPCDYVLGPPTGMPRTTAYPLTTFRTTTQAPQPRLTTAPTPRPTPRLTPGPEIPEFCNVQIQAAVRGEISPVFTYICTINYKIQ